MMKYLPRLLIFNLFLLWCFASSAAPKGGDLSFSRGVALTSWRELDGAYSTDFESKLSILKCFGIDVVRVPFLSADVDAGNLKLVVNALRSKGFRVILDFHPGDDFYRSDDISELRRVWVRVASDPDFRADDVFYELINEPRHDYLMWHDYISEIIHEIRSIGYSGYFIVGPPKYQRFDDFIGVKTFSDDGVIYSFHYYEPMLFTHQGATWDVGSLYSELEYVPFPSPAVRDLPGDIWYTKEICHKALSQNCLRQVESYLSYSDGDVFIHKNIELVSDWSRRNHVPILLGEFGVLRGHTAIESRRSWVSAVRSSVEDLSIGWIFWEFDQGFGFIHRRDSNVFEVQSSIISALGLSSCSLDFLKYVE